MNRQSKIKPSLKTKLPLFSLWFLLLFFVPGQLQAATFQMTITPYEGGSDIRFGKITPGVGIVNRELTININTTIGKQYRITETLLDPIVSAEGNSIPDRAVTVYGLSGSNKTGTINISQGIPISRGRDIVYTSNPQGSADTFRISYNLNAPLDTAPGSYRGRISFTMEAINSNQSPVIVILYIYVEIDTKNVIEIKTATGSKTISLNPSRAPGNSANVSVSIKSGLGSKFNIVQMTPEGLVSADGTRLPDQALRVSIKGAQNGSGPSTPQNLSPGRQQIYSSGPSGRSDDFTIIYELGDLNGVKAGKFRGQLKYILEGTGRIKEGLIDSFTIEVENERIFDLYISPELGSGLMQFNDLKATEPPRINEIIFEIKSNIGRPYQISQKMVSGFTNPQGNVIPQEYFKLQTVPLGNTKGTLKFPVKASPNFGEAVLFISNSQGTSDKFKAIYELGIPEDMQSGNYSTQFVFTISEL